MIKQLIITFLVCSHFLCNGQQVEIAGKIFDGKSKAGVPFATVHIEGTSLGTCANLEGEFQLKIPKDHTNSGLLFSSMGYESVRLNINENYLEDVEVPLFPSIVDLGTVTIRPVSPEDYIKQSVRKFPDNYGKQFSSNVYYRQFSSDNGNEMLFAEGFMQAYFTNFLDDTTAIDQRLLLHQTEEHLDVIAFRKRKREKKLEKAKREAAKEGILLNEDSVKRKAGKLGIDIVTPDLMMDQDPVRQMELFFDSTQFKRFTYQFEDDLVYRGRRVTAISFQTDRKVKLENMGLKGNLDGMIYFDQETDAVIGVDYNSEMVIPMAIRPILFLAGFGASNPKMTNKIRYLQVGDRWFPQSIQVDMGLDLTQKYWFKKNEKSSIDLELLMSISNINFNNPILIPEEFRFTRKEKFEDQVYPLDNTSWEEVNRIVLEDIK